MPPDRDEGRAIALDYLCHPGEHQHFCKVCGQTWWHDANPDECAEAWGWECPTHTLAGAA